ncbi:MAG: phage terminase large subunit family protein [Alphaproteobacteria bacterium]|nr:phage terminase large subunit family protein [Alphaproteobacteria bacterium]
MKSTEVLSNTFNYGIKPDSIINVSDWADANRILSQTASSEPGRFRTERTPYLREIMDALSPQSPYEKVVFMKGAQIGGTEAGNNWIGYMIDQAPGPMLVVQPTVEMGKRWSKGRLAPLISDTACLRGKVKDPRSRDSGNTVQSKEFPGGQVVITGANSAVGLRSMPVRYLFCDEVDAYPPDADSEGDPLTLAIQRTATFARRKIFIVSTPTIQGLSRIEREFNATDQRYYFVPCPFCGEFQTLKWENIHYDKEHSKVTYSCEYCKRHIEEHYKTEMLANGEWRATKKESQNEENKKVVGFHLNSLYSPVGWMSWATCYKNYEAAKKDDQLLKAWTNTTLGLPWEEKGEVPDWGILFDRREHYKIGRVPLGGYVLTAGVDVHNDRLECEIVAWGKNHESWSVDYRVIYGSPTTKEPWDKLTEILNEEFESEDGIFRKINMLAIDSGFSTQEVYAWVRNQSIHNVMAIKGVDNSLVPLNAPTKIDINLKGKKITGGVRLWKVGVSILKSEFYGWLKSEPIREEKSPAGGESAASRCHFPEYPTEYFKQLTAEQLVTQIVKGYPKREWQKTRDRNEALDCRIYARAAAIALGIDRWSDQRWEQIKGLKQGKIDCTKTLAKKIRPKIIKSRWM